MALSVLSTTTLLVALSNFSSIKKISYHQVYLIKLSSNVLPTKITSSFTAADVTDYSSATINTPYIAAEFPDSLFTSFKDFTFGNEIVTNRSMTSPQQFQGDKTKGYFNGALNPDTYYTGFQRACVNDSYCQSTSWYAIVKTKESPKKDDVNVGLIVGVVLGTAAGILLLLFLPIYVAHYRSNKAYDKKQGRHRSTVRRMLSRRFFADPRLPVSYEDFLDHVSRLRFEDNKGFIKEFSSFDHKVIHEHAASSNPQNTEKNRFYNIPAYDHCRVKLQVINNIPTSDYIHANIVSTDFKDKAYIATQAPLPGTIVDFWRMIWEYNVQTIVMLNNLVEKGEQVCSQYWPDQGKTEEYNDISVTLTEVNGFASYLVRSFELKKGSKDKVLWVKQFHYTDWPGSRDVPMHPLPMLDFLKRVNSWTPPSEEPMVVHCVSGTGRTGVFIVVNNQLKKVDEKGDISIFFNVEEVCDERFQAVKSLPEYIFIHDCTLEYFNYRDMTDIPLNAVMDTVQERSQETYGVSPFQLEFEKLSRANAKTENKSEAGNMPANRAKNRFETVVPFDATRVVLKYSKSTAEGYVNANFIDSYLTKNLFIATQAPIETTIFDFWRMIWDNDVRSVAVLLEKEMFPQNEIYWPEEGMALEAGKFHIKVLSVENLECFNLRQVTITNTKNDETRHMRLFHIKKWPNDADTENTDLYNIISMILQCKLWNEKAKGKSILVHCSSGCGRTGVFIALNNAIEQAEFDKVVNVFNIVRRMRQQRIIMIQTKNQYELVYRGISVYYRHFYSKGAEDGPAPSIASEDEANDSVNDDDKSALIVNEEPQSPTKPRKSDSQLNDINQLRSTPSIKSSTPIGDSHEMADIPKDIAIEDGWTISIVTE